MYPGLCVKHCNEKGVSGCRTGKDGQLIAFLGYKLAGLEAGRWTDISNDLGLTFSKKKNAIALMSSRTVVKWTFTMRAHAVRSVQEAVGYCTANLDVLTDS